MPVFQCGRLRKEPSNQSVAVADILILNFQLAELGSPLEGEILEIENNGMQHRVKLLEIRRSESRRPENSFEDATLIQAKVEIL